MANEESCFRFCSLVMNTLVSYSDSIAAAVENMLLINLGLARLGRSFKVLHVLYFDSSGT